MNREMKKNSGRFLPYRGLDTTHHSKPFLGIYKMGMVSRSGCLRMLSVHSWGRLRSYRRSRYHHANPFLEVYKRARVSGFFLFLSWSLLADFGGKASCNPDHQLPILFCGFPRTPTHGCPNCQFIPQTVLAL